MPETAKPQTPGAVLQSFIDKYQINPFILSKSINVAYQSVGNIINGKTRITAPMAIRLAAYFSNTPEFWLDIQTSSEIAVLTADKKFISVIKSIPKAQKPAGKAGKEKKVKTGRRKTDTLSEKRKKAAKTPGTKIARGRKAGRPPKK